MRQNHFCLFICLFFVFGLLSNSHLEAATDDYSHLQPEEEIENIDLMAFHPGQKTAGFISARKKAKRLFEKTIEKFKKYFKTHPVPVVVGPAGRTLYVVDRHHLLYASFLLNVRKLKAHIKDNKSNLTKAEFAQWMIEQNYVNLYDENDQPIAFDDLPQNISEMVDDPFRSLAGEVKDRKGFKKIDVYFLEFTWARFFRQYFTAEEISEHFEETVKKAMVIARSEAAKDMPGYLGATTETIPACKKSIIRNFFESLFRRK